MKNASCNISYDSGYVHIDKRWRRDIFLMFLISDSVTPCGRHWKKRCCGNSVAEWSQHQWKNGKNFFILRDAISVHSHIAKTTNEKSRRECQVFYFSNVIYFFDSCKIFKFTPKKNDVRIFRLPLLFFILKDLFQFKKLLCPQFFPFISVFSLILHCRE